MKTQVMSHKEKQSLDRLNRYASKIQEKVGKTETYLRFLGCNEDHIRSYRQDILSKLGETYQNDARKLYKSICMVSYYFKHNEPAKLFDAIKSMKRKKAKKILSKEEIMAHWLYQLSINYNHHGPNKSRRCWPKEVRDVEKSHYPLDLDNLEDIVHSRTESRLHEDQESDSRAESRLQEKFERK